MSQEMVERAIIELNVATKQLNHPLLPPHVTQDMHLYIKWKANHEQSRKINYSLLIDGIHPGKTFHIYGNYALNVFANKFTNDNVKAKKKET